jgi:hypothetical protein
LKKRKEKKDDDHDSAGNGKEGGNLYIGERIRKEKRNKEQNGKQRRLSFIMFCVPGNNHSRKAGFFRVAWT